MWACIAPGDRIRTTRALTMAPRARLLSRREAARLAARPRPKEPPRLAPPRDRPPAFCVALRACARKDFALGARVERIRPGPMRRSSLRAISPPQGAASGGRTALSRNLKVVPELCNVRSMSEIAGIFQPTDRPHLAAFILPPPAG